MEQVNTSYVVIYRCILPILVFLGILGNGVCVLVLRRPRLRSCQVNRYFLGLAVADVLVCVFFITTINGCTFSSLGEAYYYAYLGWPLVIFSQSLAIYLTVWLSMDRFLAVWMPWTYRRIQQWPKFVLTRILVTILGSLILTVVYVPQGTVTPAAATGNDTTSCHNGISVTVDHGFAHSLQDWQFGRSFAYFALVFLRWLPCVLLLIFNFGLIIAVARGRLSFPHSPSEAATATTTPASPTATTAPASPIPTTETPDLSREELVTKKREKELLLTMIAMISSFIIFVLPLSICVMFLTWPPDRCCVVYPQQVVRGVGSLLLVLEHDIHIFFLLALNSKFRKELRIFLLSWRNRGEDE